MTDGDVLVNKYVPSASEEGGPPLRAAPLCYKGPVAGYVDHVLISTDEEDQWIIKVLIRETRAPELGTPPLPLWPFHILPNA